MRIDSLDYSTWVGIRLALFSTSLICVVLFFQMVKIIVHASIFVADGVPLEPQFTMASARFKAGGPLPEGPW